MIGVVKDCSKVRVGTACDRDGDPIAKRPHAAAFRHPTVDVRRRQQAFAKLNRNLDHDMIHSEEGEERSWNAKSRVAEDIPATSKRPAAQIVAQSVAERGGVLSAGHQPPP